MKNVARMCPDWEAKEENLMDDSSHDLRKALLSNKDFPNISAYAQKLKDTEKEMRSVQSDGFAKCFPADLLKSAADTHALGTKTVVTTFALFQIYKTLPTLQGKPLADAIADLRSKIASKGCKLSNQLEAHLKLKAEPS